MLTTGKSEERKVNQVDLGGVARRIKVVFLVPSLSGGGAERATATIASNLDSSIFEPVLLLARDLPRLYQPAPELRVETLGLRSTLRSLLPLVRFLRRERPDVVYAALPHLNIAAALARFAVSPRPQLVVSVHSNQERELSDVRNGRVMQFIMPWVYRSAAATVVVSEGIGEELRPVVRDPARIRVISNPVDVSRIFEQSREDVKHPWFEGGYQVITAVGRLTRAKDFPSLLEAFAEVFRLRPMARLLIIGEGEERADLERKIGDLGIREAVELPGFLANPFAMVGRSACFVSSSSWEGFSMAIVEAMACGAPVVATDCAYGPAQILGQGRWGVLVQPGAPRELAEAVLSVLDDPGRRQRLSKAGLERARDFDTAVILPRLSQILEDVCVSAKAGPG